MRVLAVGGPGLVGSHHVRSLIFGVYGAFSGAQVIVLDKLTYTGNMANLAAVADSPQFIRLATRPACGVPVTSRWQVAGLEALAHWRDSLRYTFAAGSPGEVFTGRVIRPVRAEGSPLTAGTVASRPGREFVLPRCGIASARPRIRRAPVLGECQPVRRATQCGERTLRRANHL